MTKDFPGPSDRYYVRHGDASQYVSGGLIVSNKFYILMVAFFATVFFMGIFSTYIYVFSDFHVASIFEKSMLFEQFFHVFAV